MLLLKKVLDVHIKIFSPSTPPRILVVGKPRIYFWAREIRVLGFITNSVVSVYLMSLILVNSYKGSLTSILNTQFRLFCFKYEQNNLPTFEAHNLHLTVNILMLSYNYCYPWNGAAACQWQGSKVMSGQPEVTLVHLHSALSSVNMSVVSLSLVCPSQSPRWVTFPLSQRQKSKYQLYVLGNLYPVGRVWPIRQNK